MNPKSVLATVAASLVACVLSGCGGSGSGGPSLVAAPVGTAAPVPLDQAPAFVVSVGEGEGRQRFVTKITDPATIATARRFVRGGPGPRLIVTGELRAGDGGFNTDTVTRRPWSWHLDPSTVRFVENSIEIYDGRPSDIEGDLPYWLDKMGRYAPWSPTFEDEIVLPKPKAKPQ